MPNTFVPLAPVANPAEGNGFTALEFKAGTRGAANTPPACNGSTSTTRALRDCADAKITLQRQGEVVTSIRIECTCGQVIELKCVY
jgi:hypothetical protein